MISLYVPTIDHSLWPFAVLLAVFVPVSLWHERNWRAALAEYAVQRRDAGAVDESWPTSEITWVLSLQPWLLFAVAFLLALMIVFAAAVLASWPHRFPGFDESLNYFDRPYLAAMLVAGVAALVGAVALALDLMRSPWAGVAEEVRRSIYAAPHERARRFRNAVACDPGVPHEVTSPTLDSGTEGGTASRLPEVTDTGSLSPGVG